MDKPIKYFNNTSYLTTEDLNKLINIYDITFYINRSLKQCKIKKVLEKIWKPEPNYKFPVIKHNKKN